MSLVLQNEWLHSSASSLGSSPHCESEIKKAAEDGNNHQGDNPQMKCDNHKGKGMSNDLSPGADELINPGVEPPRPPRENRQTIHMNASIAKGMKHQVIRLIACLVCCCGMAAADFAESVDVNNKAEFAGAMMSKFRNLKPDGDSFASYGRRRDAVPLPGLVNIGTEKKLPVV